MKIVGIIAAGGSGERLGLAGGKQMLSVCGRPVAAWAIDALAGAELIQELIVVCDPARVEEYSTTLSAAIRTEKPVAFVPGGATRAESVCAGLDYAKDADIVAIHDGARPLLDPKDANACLQYFLDDCDADGIVLGTPAVDTLKRVGDYYVQETPDRSVYWQAQTPQVFWHDQLVKAYKQAKEDAYHGTDDASYLERRGGNIVMVPGSRANIKITTAEDLEFVGLLLASRISEQAEQEKAANGI